MVVVAPRRGVDDDVGVGKRTALALDLHAVLMEYSSGVIDTVGDTAGDDDGSADETYHVHIDFHDHVDWQIHLGILDRSSVADGIYRHCLGGAMNEVGS